LKDHGDLAAADGAHLAPARVQGRQVYDLARLGRASRALYRVVKEDLYTSIHIEEFDAEVRETKLGMENITRDIPNIGEEAFRDLDEEGIVRVGATVKPGSILVGKVTPKGETDITPEYKLLNSIFGEKAKNVKDTSLRVPHGTEGTVVDIRRLRREDGARGIRRAPAMRIGCVDGRLRA